MDLQSYIVENNIPRTFFALTSLTHLPIIWKLSYFHYWTHFHALIYFFYDVVSRHNIQFICAWLTRHYFIGVLPMNIFNNRAIYLLAQQQTSPVKYQQILFAGSSCSIYIECIKNFPSIVSLMTTEEHREQ